MYHPSWLFTAVSFSCLIDQELCIGHDTPLNTIAHSGVITRTIIDHQLAYSR
jgi:hypothetical protein